MSKPQLGRATSAKRSLDPDTLRSSHQTWPSTLKQAILVQQDEEGAWDEAEEVHSAAAKERDQRSQDQQTTHQGPFQQVSTR